MTILYNGDQPFLYIACKWQSIGRGSSGCVSLDKGVSLQFAPGNSLPLDCHSFKSKAGALQQYLNTLDPKPDIIAVQETNGPTKLPGYITYEDPSKKAAATLVRNKIADTQHLTPATEGLRTHAAGDSISLDKTKFQRLCPEHLLSTLHLETRNSVHDTGCTKPRRTEPLVDSRRFQRASSTVGLRVQHQKRTKCCVSDRTT